MKEMSHVSVNQVRPSRISISTFSYLAASFLIERREWQHVHVDVHVHVHMGVIHTVRCSVRHVIGVMICIE